MFDRKEDYIMRIMRLMLPFFASGLAEILHLKKRRQYDEASVIIQTTAEKILGMKMDLMVHLPYDHLLSVLRDDVPEGMVKCLVLAELLKETASIYEFQDKVNESYLCYAKSFNIFFQILFIKDSASLLEYLPQEELQRRFESLSVVTEQLRSFQLSEEVLFKIMSYYEQIGAFSMAEDLIFETIETAENPQVAIEQGIDFFKRLRLKTDAQLIAGNLPRDEVESGLKELQDQLE